MRERENTGAQQFWAHRICPAKVRERVPGFLPPTAVRAFVRLHAYRIFTVLLLLAGAVAQLVALWALGELVDLYVSAVELWAELARKHLELTS